MSEEKKLNGTVIVTYRCNARCSMDNTQKSFGSTAGRIVKAWHGVRYCWH